MLLLAVILRIFMKELSLPMKVYDVDINDDGQRHDSRDCKNN